MSDTVRYWLRGIRDGIITISLGVACSNVISHYVFTWFIR